MKLNKKLRSLLSFALAAAMTVTMLTPTVVFAQPEAEEAAEAEAVAAAAGQDISDDISDEAVEAGLDALPREELDAHLVSYQAVTDTVSYAGQKLVGVFIQYDDNVQAGTLRTSTYDVQAFKGDNKTLASAQITAVYTNSEPAFRDDKTSVEGPYVIIETSPYDGVGTLDLSNVYVTDKDGKEYATGGYGNIESVDPIVAQKAHIALSDVLVKSGTLDQAKAVPTFNKNYDEFETLYLDSEKNNYGDGKITVQYHLPDNYSADGKYPLIVVQCGGGLRMRELANEAGEIIYRSRGANIAFDTAVTSWMDDEFKTKPYYEDMIVISVDNRNIPDSEAPEARYVAADDINQTVEYFIANYAVDPDRVYYSGNSQGSLIGYQTVSSRPDLWTAFMACNGLALTSPDPFTSEENMAEYMKGVALVMDPITDNHVAMYWNLGETDLGASGPRGELFYNYAKSRYEAQGMDEEQIDAILRLNVFADEEYLQYGITNADGSAYAHGATKLAYTAHKDEFQPWILGQTKGEKPVPTGIAADIVSVQAYTGGTFYGTAVQRVVITFKDGVDVSGLGAEDFVLEDRGSLNPDFGQVRIASIAKSRKTVTLYILDDTQATEKNSLVYTGNGDDKGVRERNAFGIYPTGNWYRDPEGVIRFGDGTQGYAANETGKGYWIRPSLELRLRYAADEGFDAAMCLADAKGQYNTDGLWLPTVDTEFGDGLFKSLYDLEIPSTAAPATDGTADPYVRGYYYVPENYDPANGIVFYIQGNAISYWQIQDGTNNAGCGFMYDVNTWSWRNKGCIAVNIQDRSGYAKGDYQLTYDYVDDDVRVMKYFIDTYKVTGNIVIQGNSRGTMASSAIIKALAGQPYTAHGDTITLDKSVYDFHIDTYICQNGSLGSGYKEDDWAAVAKTGMRVWCFDGEQDSNNINSVATYSEALRAEGCPEEWIKENVRLTGLSSDMFAYWGESDHSVTRLNPWYFADAAYYGPGYHIEEGGKLVYDKKLEDGDTYTLPGRGTAATNNKNGYEYTVYDDLFQVWALRRTDEGATGVKACAVTEPGYFGQKVKAVILEFPKDVDGKKLGKDSFVVRDLANNLTGAYRSSVIEKIYVNDAPEVGDKGLDSGKYVVIETNDFDKVGLVADNWYYYRQDGGVGSIARRKDLAGVYYLDVRALSNIIAADGSVALEAQSAPTVIEEAAIKHDVLDEFQYVYLNDEEADAVLAKFTFKNNNSPYSLSSNSRNYDHTKLAENERLGDLNYATLAGLGVRIWYQLPDNYDPAKTYPLFLYAHGTGESFTTATAGDGTQYTNHGVHFNIGMPTGAWATTEDFGYEDCIVVAPQYYNGNSPREDGYERDDAFRVALCYALDTFAVDRDRVFVSGTSQGAGRTTALVRDCAEYITAAIVQNGAYSSALSRSTDLDPIGQHKMIFKFATDENVAFWFFQGVNDRVSPALTSETMWNALNENYKEAGRTDGWLEDHVRYTYLNDKIYLDMNETSFHSTMKPTYLWYAYYNDQYYDTYSDAEDSLGKYFDTKYGKNDPNGYAGLIDWALSQRKSELSGKTDMVEAFVRKLYLEFLGREPDAKGLATWTEVLSSGKATMARLVLGFVDSAEYKSKPQTDEEFVTALYRIIFDREPDADGLKAWLDVLDSGLTRKKVLEGFINSDEFKALADRLGVQAGSYKSDEYIDAYPNVTAFVSRLYRQVLNRRATTGELEGWVKALTQGRSATQVVRGFFGSREMNNRNLGASEVVGIMYKTILNREPDVSGYNNWVPAYNRVGADKVLDGFLKSPEFADLAKDYGINP
jgi:predicted peptidase